MKSNKIFIQNLSLRYLSYAIYKNGIHLPSVIYYLDANNKAKYIKSAFKWVLKDISFKQIHIGKNWYKREKIEMKISQEIFDLAFSQSNFLDFFSVKLSAEMSQSFIKKIIVRKIRNIITVLLEDNLSETDTCVLSDEGLGKDLRNTINKNFPNQKDCFYISDSDFTYYLFRYIFMSFRTILGCIIHLNHDHKNASSSDKPAICFPYNWGIEDDYYDQDDAWVKYVTEPHRTIIYFDQNTKKIATNRIIKECIKNDYEFKILNKKSNKTEYPIDRYNRMELKLIIRDLFHIISFFFSIIKKHNPKVQLELLFKLLPNLRRKQAFIRVENIKVLFDLSETTDDVGSIACELEQDAIKIGKHWSYICWPRSNLLPIQRVYFTWSEYISKILKDTSSYPHYIVSGNQFFRDSSKICELSDDQRKLIKGKKVIGLLDRSINYKSILVPSSGIKFFRRLIEMIDQNPNYVILYKPKDIDGKLRIFDYDQKLKGLINNYIKNKRIIILDGSSNADIVGKYADITIAMGVNSAGFNLALTNSRVVYWDPSGFINEHGSEAFGPNHNNLIFENLERLFSSLNSFLKGERMTEAFGDQSKLISRINEKTDCSHNENIGIFISRYLKNISNGYSREKSLLNVVESFKG